MLCGWSDSRFPGLPASFASLKSVSSLKVLIALLVALEDFSQDAVPQSRSDRLTDSWKGDVMWAPAWLGMGNPAERDRVVSRDLPVGKAMQVADTAALSGRGWRGKTGDPAGWGTAHSSRCVLQICVLRNAYRFSAGDPPQTRYP